MINSGLLLNFQQVNIRIEDNFLGFDNSSIRGFDNFAQNVNHE